jgi:putative DNA methylase
VDRYPKRLIEVDLPIKRISAHARREKSIRHGHISTLHIWWARRPLAACRAVICAALWPDPADELCPPAFRDKARTEMQKWTTHDWQALLSADSRSRFEKARQNPALFKDTVQLRGALLDFIADFANWDNSTIKEFLDTSRALTQAAHEALGGASGTRPLVVDPFAGGGSIPLEALRVGADAFASDLNPVAVLLNKVVLEYIPKYGQRLADEVRKWGEWIKQEAEKELAEFYPKNPDGAAPIAYIWARTVISEAPAEDKLPIEVPLMSSFWLSKKPQRRRALRWTRNKDGTVKSEVVIFKYSDGTTKKVQRPLLEVFDPKSPGEVEAPPAKRGSCTCPITGYTTPAKRVRAQLIPRRGGANDARLVCVVAVDRTERGRIYRVPTRDDFKAFEKAQATLFKLIHKSGPESVLPNEALPIMSGVFNAPIYGHDTWGTLFNSRQALSILTFKRLIKEAGRLCRKENPSSEIWKSVVTVLGLNLGKLADYGSALATWSSPASQETIRNTFGRQALPMVWDYAEANPFAASSGGWSHSMGFVCLALEHGARGALPVGHCERANAASHPLADDSAALFVTDPPYYNAVPYADLSDFFYVWLKRCLREIHEELFETELSPKADECCEMAGWDPVRYPEKNGQWFERKMESAMREGRRILASSGAGVVVFAHKSTSGWEAQLQAMLDAGLVVTGSWPIDTERSGRMRANDSAALASSIHIVVRPRENPDGSVLTDQVGDWRDVLAELPYRIHEWMPRLAEEGVVGADAIFACIGPALEIFSRYSRVEKANGEAVFLKEYLEQVWAAVAKEALTMIFTGADATGFEEDARLTAMWMWTLKTGETNGEGEIEEEDDTDEEGREKKVKTSGFVLEYDAARKIAQGLGAHLERLPTVVEIKGETARLVSVGERAAHLFGKEASRPKEQPKKKKAQPSLFVVMDEVQEEVKEWEIKAGKIGETVLDRLHQSMILFGAGRGEALRRFLVEDGLGRDQRLWRLAQAFSALYPTGTDEKRWVDGVLARKKGLGF